MFTLNWKEPNSSDIWFSEIMHILNNITLDEISLLDMNKLNIGHYTFNILHKTNKTNEINTINSNYTTYKIYINFDNLQNLVCKSNVSCTCTIQKQHNVDVCKHIIWLSKFLFNNYNFNNCTIDDFESQFTPFYELAPKIIPYQSHCCICLDKFQTKQQCDYKNKHNSKINYIKCNICNLETHLECYMKYLSISSTKIPTCIQCKSVMIVPFLNNTLLYEVV